jgi:hypothetical protein
VAHTRLCPAYRFRADGTVTATEWQESMEDAQRWLVARKVSLNRCDLGLGHDAVRSWHEEAAERPKYLFKLNLTSRVRTALGKAREITKWLRTTAPQLKYQMTARDQDLGHMAPFSRLKRAFNCGF